MTRSDRNALCMGVILAVLMSALFLTFPAAKEPYKPWRYTLEIGGGLRVSGDGRYLSRLACERELGDRLLSLADGPLLIRHGRCWAPGWEI